MSRREQRNPNKYGVTLGLLAVVAIISYLYPAVSAGAQEAGDPQNFYEGQQVGIVDLAGRAPAEVESLRSLMLQKAGEPYSAEKVQETAAALQRTGRFNNVNIEVAPEPDGLRVLFVLQPAYYLGVSYFPGAIGHFTYSQLLNVANFPGQEPYEQSRVNAAVPALQKFFADNGYFTAHVESETQFDEHQHVANVVFHVTLNRLAKLGDIAVVGLPQQEAAKLESALHSLRARFKGAYLRSGRPFNSDHLRAASSLISARLTDENRLAGQVQREPPVYHPETNRADVALRVTLGPIVEVRTDGFKISSKQVKRLVPIWEENAVDQDLVDEGQRHMVSYLQNKGYFNVKIAPQISDSPEKVTVAYEITPGTRYRVQNVSISGNRHLASKRLMQQVLVKKANLLSRGKFSQDLLNSSIKNLEAVYANEGFAEAKIRPDVTNREPNIEVAFIVTEGDQTIVSGLHVEGNHSLDLKAIAPSGFQLRAGQPYSLASLNNDRSRIIARYLDLGYHNATFRSSAVPVNGNGHRVEVTYIIEEGSPVHIDQVAYVGQKVTRQSFLERNITLRPGSPLSESEMMASESKLYNLGDFDWADVSPLQSSSDNAEQEVVVKVHEAQRNSVSWGFGFLATSRSGSLSSGVLSLPGLPTVGLPKGFSTIEKTIISPIGSLEFSRYNLFGEGQTASLSTSLSLLDQKAIFTYSIPQIGGLGWDALFSASIERSEQNPLFTARLASGSWQLERVLDRKRTQRLQVRYSLQQSHLSNLLIMNFVPQEDLSIRSSFPSITYIRDTRDKPLDAHKGVFQTLDVRINPTAFGASENYIRVFGQSSFYRQLKPWLVWANNFRLGLEKPFAGSHVPFGDLFFSGGADSLRGFPLNGAGPQKVAVLCTQSNNPSTCTADVTVPTGGPELVIVNTEGRFPIPLTIGPIKGLGGVIFYDGGNVYAHASFNGLITNFGNTVGFGLRYQTPVGPIRVDIGQNLNPVPGLKATQIFVTLGQAF